MEYEITLFTIPQCNYCNGLKKRLEELKIPYNDFDVIKFREDWLKIIQQIGVDILPTIYVKERADLKGVFYIPGKDYFTEDEIVEILKRYFKIK